MNTQDTIKLARKHIASAQFETSARLCLNDAVKCHDAGELPAAKNRALKSLQFSVGVFHPDYCKAIEEPNTHRCVARTSTTFIGTLEQCIAYREQCGMVDVWRIEDRAI